MRDQFSSIVKRLLPTAELYAQFAIGRDYLACCVNERSIKIENVSEIDPRTSTEPTVLHHFRDEIAAQGGPITVAAEEE